MSSHRVLVCGGREYNDWVSFVAAMEPHRKTISVIIHGCARGAESLADKWGRLWEREVVRFRADWKRDGKAAGPIRNQRMLDEGKPDTVIAFPGGRGTTDMVRRARAAGIHVIEVSA